MIKIGNNTKIDNTCILKGDVVIGEDCEIEAYSVIENSIIGNKVKVHHSFIVSSHIDEESIIGPFSHIRNNSKIGKKCRIGNFVEIKNSILYEGVKCAHHAYLGDCIIGENTNIGNGVVSANYDGTSKHQSIIGKRCFIGCKCILIAPINIEDDVFVAAGTIVNQDIKKESFVIGRTPLIVKENKRKKK